MNRKKFTIGELLIAIIILVLLAVVANSSVTNVVKNSKSDLYNAQIELIKNAAETWGLDNIDKLPEEGSCAYLKLKDLKTYGLLKEEIINPKTNQPFSDNIKIKITSKINNKSVLKPVYEVDAKSVSNCTEVYPPICTLVKDADKNNKITPGDEYVCTVKENTNYTFYILSENTNGTYNLILNSNINSLGESITSNEIGDKGFVAWISNEDYGCEGENCAKNDKGPITALQYLYNITKDWTNIPNIIMNYMDENINNITGRKGTIGYGEIKTNNNITNIFMKDGNITSGDGYTNLKARLPRFDEIHAQCPLYYDDEKNGAEYCPLWLVNYLKHDDKTEQYYPLSEGKIIVNDINGYWILSSSGYDSYYAWSVIWDGDLVDNFGGVDSLATLGVRPVITLSLD